jgi:hypothetical protein
MGKMAKMKMQVVVYDKETGDIIAKMEGPDFMKTIGAPKDMFVQDGIDEYNKKYPENKAQLEVLVSKRGKWQTLGSAEPVLKKALRKLVENK